MQQRTDNARRLTTTTRIWETDELGRLGTCTLNAKLAKAAKSIVDIQDRKS